MNNVLSIEKLGMSNVSHFQLYNTGKLFIINLTIDKEVTIITKSCKNSFTTSLKWSMQIANWKKCNGFFYQGKNSF